MDEIETRELEEKLREAASIGDIEMLRNLVEVKNVDINSQNKMNGRTALHWGAKRNHPTVVQYLLSHGAVKDTTDNEGKTPGHLTTGTEVHSLLGGQGDVAQPESLAITPSYLAHPPFPYSSKSDHQSSAFSATNGDPLSRPTIMNNHTSAPSDDELVLKVRVAHRQDPDFIEVELPRDHLRYEALLNLMCAELGVDKQLVGRVRKLPNTILRKDKDVARLRDFQELELVLTTRASSAMSRGYTGVAPSPALASEQILY
ncbi:hypothetical protein ACOMHN_012709 [Nucella lapillus]